MTLQTQGLQSLEQLRAFIEGSQVHKRTWEKDLERYELRLKEAFGRKKLDQIRRQEIQSFHAGLRNEGLSPAYADHFIKLLRHALNLAVEWEMLEIILRPVCICSTPTTKWNTTWTTRSWNGCSVCSRRTARDTAPSV